MSDRSNEVIKGVSKGESVAARAAHGSLKGERRCLGRPWPFPGPAFVAAAHAGTPATSPLAQRAQFGRPLLWVIPW